MIDIRKGDVVRLPDLTVLSVLKNDEGEDYLILQNGNYSFEVMPGIVTEIVVRARE